MSGLINDNILENGEITKWKDMAPLHGQTKENTPDAI